MPPSLKSSEFGVPHPSPLHLRMHLPTSLTHITFHFVASALNHCRRCFPSNIKLILQLLLFFKVFFHPITLFIRFFHELFYVTLNYTGNCTPQINGVFTPPPPIVDCECPAGPPRGSPPRISTSELHDFLRF